MFVLHRPQQGPVESFHYPELISASAGKESCRHRQWEFLLHTVLALGPKKTPHTLFLIPYWHVKEPVRCNFLTTPLTIWGETLSIRGSADYPTCSADRPLRSISISLLKGDSRDWLLLLYSAWAGWDIFRLLPFPPYRLVTTHCPLFALLVFLLLTVTIRPYEMTIGALLAFSLCVLAVRLDTYNTVWKVGSVR